MFTVRYERNIVSDWEKNLCLNVKENGRLIFFNIDCFSTRVGFLPYF